MPKAVLRRAGLLLSAWVMATIACASKSAGPVVTLSPPPPPPPGTSVSLPPAARLTFWFADNTPGGGHHDFYRDGTRWFEVGPRGMVAQYAEVAGEDSYVTIQKAGDTAQLRMRGFLDLSHGQTGVEFRQRETDEWSYRWVMFPVRRGAGDGWRDRENTFLVRGGNLAGEWIAETDVIVYEQRRAGTLRRWLGNSADLISFVGDQRVQTYFPDETQTQNGYPYKAVGPPEESIFLPFALYADQTVRLPAAGNTWRRDTTTAIRLVPDSQVRIDVTTALERVVPGLLRDIPSRINEPYGDYRATFDRVGNPAVSFENGRLVVRADYQGDIEGTGCHLRPVYPRATLSADLVLTQVRGGGWELKPSDTTFQVTLNPGSDTQCSIFPINIGRLLEQFLNSDVVVDKFLSGLSGVAKGISVPIPEIWKTLQGPMVLKRPGEQQMCIYGHPKAFSLGTFSGNAASVRFPIFVRSALSAVLADADTCGKPDQAFPPPPRQSAVEGRIGMGAAGPVPNSIAIESAIDVSYARIAEAIRSSLSGSAADVVDDIHLHGEAATLLVALRLKTPALSVEYRLFPGLDETAHKVTMVVHPTPETLAAAAGQQDLVNDLARAIESAFPLDFSAELSAVTAKLSGSYTVPIDPTAIGALAGPLTPAPASSTSTISLTVGAVRDLPQLILCGPRSLRAYVLLSGPVTATARF